MPTQPQPLDWFGFLIEVCQVLTPIIVAVLAYYQNKNTTHLKELAHSVNSVKDELVASTDRAAMAEGHQAGVLDERQRVADDAAGTTQDRTNAAAQAHNAEREKEKKS